jgi:hypothetical protein
MTMPSPRRCSAPPSIGRSSRSRNSLIWMLPGDGRRASCTGTTRSTGTAASATSPPRSVMADRMAACSPPATRSTRTRENATRNAGVGRPATGHRLAWSRSMTGKAPLSRPLQQEVRAISARRARPLQIRRSIRRRPRGRRWEAGAFTNTDNNSGRGAGNLHAAVPSLLPPEYNRTVVNCGLVSNCNKRSSLAARGPRRRLFRRAPRRVNYFIPSAICVGSNCRT